MDFSESHKLLIRVLSFECVKLLSREKVGGHCSIGYSLSIFEQRTGEQGSRRDQERSQDEGVCKSPAEKMY